MDNFERDTDLAYQTGRLVARLAWIMKSQGSDFIADHAQQHLLSCTRAPNATVNLLISVARAAPLEQVYLDWLDKIEGDLRTIGGLPPGYQGEEWHRRSAIGYLECIGDLANKPKRDLS